MGRPNVAKSIVPLKKNMVAAISGELERAGDEEKYEPLADAVIWLGDLNYRINGVIGAVVHAMQKNMFEVLLVNDQFNLERKIGRVPGNFKEAKICFPPTYKLNKGSDSYNVTARVPGWTDRILYNSRGNILEQKSYDSNNNLKISDHRPVFG